MCTTPLTEQDILIQVALNIFRLRKGTDAIIANICIYSGCKEIFEKIEIDYVINKNGLIIESGLHSIYKKEITAFMTEGDKR